MGIRTLNPTLWCVRPTVTRLLGRPHCSPRHPRGATGSDASNSAVVAEGLRGSIGSPGFNTAQREHAAHWAEGHDARDVRPAPCSRAWIPVSTALPGSPWQARFGVSFQKEGHLCQWLFLASPPRVSVRLYPQDPRGVLDSEIGREPYARLAESGDSGEAGLEGPDRVGVRDHRCGAVDAASEAVSASCPRGGCCEAGSNE